MATAKIVTKTTQKLREIKPKNFLRSRVTDSGFASDIKDKVNFVRLIEEKNSFKNIIVDLSPATKISQTLPFRIRLTNIVVPGYSANNIPGIGVQVIGFSNYIL